MRSNQRGKSKAGFRTEVEQNFSVAISVSNNFTSLASPKVGCASDEKINPFILFFSRLALPLRQSRNSTLRDTAKWCRN